MESKTKASYMSLVTNFESKRMAKDTAGSCKQNKRKQGLQY